MTRPERRLATVLFTDIVDSTKRAAEVGDRRWRELLQRHHAVVRRELARFGGRELNMTGDGFLAAFDVPERALRCAWAIREALEPLGLVIRAGLHTGEVEVMENTAGGLGVHIAARVLAQAGPGEVLVSSTVRDVVAGSGFDFEDRGVHALKGVPGEWRLSALASAPVRLPVSSFWARAREARLPRILLAYVAAGAAILWLAFLLQDRIGLPPWVSPFAVVLLLIGLVVLTATAFVQSHPITIARAEREELPGSWELDLRDAGRSVARGRVPHLTWGRSLLGGVVAFSLLFGLAGLYVVIRDRGRTFSPKAAVAESAAPGLAVLPFDVRGPGLEVWREGMVDLLSTNLDGVAGLRTIDSRTVLARWDERVQGARRPDLATALEVARRTGARYALVGNAVSIGPDVRLTAEMYDLETATSRGRSQVEGPPDSVLALVDRLSVEAVRVIAGGTVTDLGNIDLAHATTPSLPALKAYLEGEVLFRRSRFEDAIPLYQRALEADSTFALAAGRLSSAYGWTESILSEVAQEYGERAMRLVDRLPAREAVLVRSGFALDQASLDGLDPLRTAVRQYPDDVEAWMLLGETYWHLGDQALLAQDESDRAFEKTIELDPRFAPGYIHLIDNAFVVHDDSARAAKLLENYRRVAAGGREGQMQLTELQRSFDLAFGSSQVRERARAELDTLSAETLFRTVSPELSVPRLLGVREEVLTELMTRSDRSQATPILLLLTYASRGKLRVALELLDDGRMPKEMAAVGTYMLHLYELPVPQERLDSTLLGTVTDSGATRLEFFVGAYAAERESWDRHAAAIARLRAVADASFTRGDSVQGRYFRALAGALEGYALHRQGQPEKAERLLVAAQREATGFGPAGAANTVIRWWIGRMLLDAGKPRDAERYFASFWFEPQAKFYLARTYEELGEFKKARDAYLEFAEAWKDADPALRPRAEEARASAARLTSVIRER